MKCKKCGAHYRTRKLRCPYCGTANPKGEQWHSQRESAEKELQQLESTRGKDLRLQAANKALNRVLLFEGIAIAVFLLGVFLWFMLADAALRLRTRFNKAELEQQMQQLYSEQRLTELNDLMDEYGLFGEDYYEYSQAALLGYDYDRFVQARMELFACVQAGEQPDESLTWRLVNSMNDILVPYIPAYPRLTEQNAALQAEFAADVLSCAQGWLAIDKEAVALLHADWLTTEQEAALQQKILEVTA